jgi:hypothetical protein
MAVPISRLHGSTGSGSAAAPVNEVVTPVVVAPAIRMPRPSSARRSMRPLPATSCVESPRRLLRIFMMSSWRTGDKTHGRVAPQRVRTVPRPRPFFLVGCKPAEGCTFSARDTTVSGSRGWSTAGPSGPVPTANSKRLTGSLESADTRGENRHHGRDRMAGAQESPVLPSLVEI